MAEIRQIDYDKISVSCRVKEKDFIPNNWYVPARKAWQIFAWTLLQIRKGAVIRSDKDVDSFIHKYWEYVEDHAFAYGEEKEDEDQTCYSNRYV